MREYQDVKDLQITSEKLADVYYKPKSPIVVAIVIAVLIFLINSIYAKILGVFVLALGLAVLKFVKDYIVLTFYKDRVVLFKNDKAYEIEYDEISEWNTSSEKDYQVLIKLKDGRQASVETFNTTEAYKQFDKLIPEKSTLKIQQERIRNVEIKAGNPITNIKNLFKTLTKKKG